MILVLLGTQNNSFSRLLNKIEECIDNKIINEEVIVQAGYTKYDSTKMKILDFISQDELNDLINQAELIITHGGVGSITSSIKSGKKVIAVPRLEKFSEHVNDHQIQIIEKFDKEGYILGVNDLNNLPDIIQKSKDFSPKKYIKDDNNKNNILSIVENYIDNN